MERKDMGRKDVERPDLEMDIREVLQDQVEIPKVVDESLEDAYGKIRRGEVRMKQLNGWKKKSYKKAGMAAAAACMVIALTGVFYVNPALAKGIPILEDVFGKIQEMRDASPYPDKDSTQYQAIEEHSRPVTDPTNTAEDQGIAIEVSDVYCDGYDLYFTLSLKTDDEEMKTADRIDFLSYRDGDTVPYWSWLNINGEEVYPSELLSVKKAEDNVFVGLIRVQSMMSLASGQFPDDITVKLDVGGVGAHKNGVPEEGNELRTGFKSIEGSWQLEFTAKADRSNNRTTTPEAEKDGFTVKEITKTPADTYLTVNIPAEWEEKNPAPVLLDGEGNKIQPQSGRSVEQDDGSWNQYLVLDYTDSEQFTFQMYDKNSDTEAEGYPPLIVEIPFSMDK